MVTLGIGRWPSCTGWLLFTGNFAKNNGNWKYWEVVWCSEPIKSRMPCIWLSGHLGAKVTCRHQWPPGAARALSFVIWVVSAFYSTKIQDWNFGNFTLWMEWCYQLNLSDPIHCMFCSKSGSRDSNFVKWKGAMKWPDWSKWTTFNCGHKYCGRIGHKWSVPFDLQEKFP